jgi:hypothetical protein
MNHKIIFAAILILSANKTFGQDSIKGRIIDYETIQALSVVTIVDGNNSLNGTIPDEEGNFKLKVEGNKRNLELYLVSYYPIKFFNIPKGDKTIDFKEIKMLRNHLGDHRVTGMPYRPYSERQWEQDKKLRTDVLKNYRIKIMGKKLKPYFTGPFPEHQYLVFDFNTNENE